jgi:hypothetical protein
MMLLLKKFCAVAVKIGFCVLLKVNKLFKSTHHCNKCWKWIHSALKQTWKHCSVLVSSSLTLMDVSQMCLSSSSVWGLFGWTLFFRFPTNKIRDLSLQAYHATVCDLPSLSSNTWFKTPMSSVCFGTILHT